METAVIDVPTLNLFDWLQQYRNNSSASPARRIAAHANLIAVASRSAVLCQAGDKSPYITVIGCSAVTKAPYNRL